MPRNGDYIMPDNTNTNQNTTNNSDQKPQTKPDPNAPKIEPVHLTEGFESGNIKDKNSDD